MIFIVAALPFVQIALAVILVVFVLIQQRGAGLGGAFGDTGGTTFYTRRGLEQQLFVATFIVAGLFILSALAAIL